MPVLKCALGVIQQRGALVINPALVALGAPEEDFLWRHVVKVRAPTDAHSRSLFIQNASAPGLLDTIRTTPDDAAYEASAVALQDLLAQAMKTSTNARDCVFAVVRASDIDGAEAHVTLLKLDAVVEAARMQLLAEGGVSFQVLRELLPEPGKLQKALSWPDRRGTSEVIMLDTNVTTAQYFENAYQVKVSPRSSEAEAMLHDLISTHVELESLPAAVAAAAELSGPLDGVLDTLSETYPALTDIARDISEDGRPPGIVRTNKIAARPIVWRADGIEVRVPPGQATSVVVERTDEGWRLSIETRTEPRRGS